MIRYLHGYILYFQKGTFLKSMHKLIRDTISISNLERHVTLDNTACYEWKIIPVNKALTLINK